MWQSQPPNIFCEQTLVTSVHSTCNLCDVELMTFSVFDFARPGAYLV